MNTNLRKTIGQFTAALVTTFALAALTLRAHAQGGIPLWTNFYNGPGNDNDYAAAVAVDTNGNVFVTGWSAGAAADYATIKYSNEGTPLWTTRYDGVHTISAMLSLWITAAMCW